MWLKSAQSQSLKEMEYTNKKELKVEFKIGTMYKKMLLII